MCKNVDCRRLRTTRFPPVGIKDDATAQLYIVMSDITVSTTCLALEGPLSPWGTLMTHTCGHCDNIYTVQCTFQKVSCEKKDKIIQKKWIRIKPYSRILSRIFAT